jgi:Tol biopolymer transport system component
VPVQTSNSTGGSEPIKPRKAFLIDFASRTLETELEIDQVATIGEWDYRKGRWNPWSADGKHLTFVRQGQVWISDANGTNAKQITFDGSNKVFPAFSPDGTEIAYVTFQFDNREHYTRLGPTDIWVVDIRTGLAARLTQPDAGRIEALDWLDARTLIFDRISSDRHSTLRTVSLR